jgi:hypothetical protein
MDLMVGGARRSGLGEYCGKLPGLTFASPRGQGNCRRHSDAHTNENLRRSSR